MCLTRLNKAGVWCLNCKRWFDEKMMKDPAFLLDLYREWYLDIIKTRLIRLKVAGRHLDYYVVEAKENIKADDAGFQHWCLVKKERGDWCSECSRWFIEQLASVRFEKFLHPIWEKEQSMNCQLPADEQGITLLSFARFDLY